MLSLRAQQIAKTNQIFYSDIPINFDMSPTTGDLALITNNNSVNQSLENIILTMAGERLYNPTLGTAVGMNAFELASYFVSEVLISDVTIAIQNYEPRVTLQNITVDYPNDNAVNVNIYYFIINNNNIQNYTVTIQRTR